MTAETVAGVRNQGLRPIDREPTEPRSEAAYKRTDETHDEGPPPQRAPRAADTPWGRLRGRTGWSLRELSAHTGISPADLSRIERFVGGVTPEQARRLLAVYDEAGGRHAAEHD